MSDLLQGTETEWQGWNRHCNDNILHDYNYSFKIGVIV